MGNDGMRIEKKIWPQFFGKVASGEKAYELRLADFDCNPGDTLVLREWDPETRQYTGRSIEKSVTSVFRTKDQKFWPKEDTEKYGFQVIGFR
jgi:hypothetical protein